MNETKKLYSILIVGLVFVAVIITAAIIDSKKGEKYLEEVDKAFESKEAKLLYLGRPTCGYCSLLKPVLDRYSKEYKFDFSYINMDEIGESKQQEIFNKLSLDVESFGTPYIAIVKDDKKVDEQSGYVTEDVFFDFLKKNGFIPEDAELALNYIDYNQYSEMLEKGEKEIYVMVQTGCSHCENAKPVLEEIAKEYDIKINILNISNFESEEEQTKFNESLSYLNENQWGTPLMLIVENKEIKDKKEGFSSKKDYIDFFKKNGYIK